MLAEAVGSEQDLRATRLLVADDSWLDFEILVASLEQEQMAVSAHRVENRPQLQQALAQQAWDAVLCEHALPDLGSIEALRLVRQTDRHLPFIIVSARLGEESAVAAMRAGADDCLVKGRLARLAPALLNALSIAQTRRDHERAVQALAASERQLQLLLAHLDAVVSEERTAIAREIHDDIGGMLTALRFDLSWIERHGDSASATRARTAAATLTQVMQSAQRIQRNLRPPVLDTGLLPALQWLIDDFRRRTGLATDFSCNVDALDLAEEAAMAIYRTLQEALVNIGKHAQAQSVSVGLVVDDQQLSLQIIDDGIGHQPEDLVRSGSFGLRGLAERARRAGGWIDLSPLARGSCLLLSLPLGTPPLAPAADVCPLGAQP